MAAEGFEPLDGEDPLDLIDRDPSGRLAAYSVGPEPRAGVWDIETKRLVWDGAGATAIAWFPTGDEIAVVRSDLVRGDGALQSDYGWSFERRTWPLRDLVSTCELRNWNTDFRSVAVSPGSDRAVVGWGHQGEAGLVLIDVSNGAQQVRGASWDTFHTNWLSTPAWSPDGSLVAVFENAPGAGSWWGSLEYEEPSPGGEFVAATLVILRADLTEVERMPLRVRVPAGWLPAVDEDRGIAAFRFDKADRLRVHVPGRGEERLSIASLH